MWLVALAKAKDIALKVYSLSPLITGIVIGYKLSWLVRLIIWLIHLVI